MNLKIMVIIHYCFNLKCLNSDPRTFELIKREIDARNWFLLCNSINSKESEWVQREVNYIKNLLPKKNYEELDLNSSWEEQKQIIENCEKSDDFYRI